MGQTYATPSTSTQAPAPAVDTPSPKTGRGNAANQGLVGDQSVHPDSLPPAGQSDNASVNYVVLARGDKANKGAVTLHAARVSTEAALWERPVDGKAVSLAQENGAPVVQLLWPAGWGTVPTTHELGDSLQPLTARLATATAHDAKGWSKVQNGSTIDALLAGETNALSNAAQRTFRNDVSGGGFLTKSDTDQAAFLDGLAGSKDARPDVVAEPVNATAAKVQRTGPVVEKDHDFVGTKGDANVYTLTFEDGQVIKIFMPIKLDPKLAYHTVDQIEEAVAKLPPASRKRAVDVTMNPGTNPDDKDWAVTYNDPNFHSYMTAGGEGRVTIYPDEQMSGQDYMNGTIIHETGHTWSYQQWGEDETKGGWIKWREAMGKDKASPSNYATNAIAEDVAETVQIYGSTKGRPAYAEYKAILPNRFAILEAEMK